MTGPARRVPHLDERQRRLLMAAEARSWGTAASGLRDWQLR
ncbi:hypothetical protein [Streptomyces sp. NPDC127084]